MWYCKMYFPGRHEVIESDGKTYRRFTYIGEGDA